MKKQNYLGLYILEYMTSSM